MGWQDAPVVNASPAWAGAPVVGQSQTPSGGIGRQVALAGRDVGEGVFDTLMAPRDLGTKLVNLERRGINSLFGTNLPQSPMYSDQLSQALTKGGAPVPTTPGEQL